MQSLKLVALTLPSLLLSGCVSYLGGGLKPIPREQLAIGGAREDLTFQATRRANGKEWLRDRGSKGFSRVIEGLLVETQCFATVANKTRGGGLHCEFAFDETYNEMLVDIWSYITGLTLFLVPCVAKSELAFKADFYRDGKMLKSYEYKNSSTLLMHLLLLPALPFYSATDNFQQMNRIFVFHALNDAKQDGLIRGQ